MTHRRRVSCQQKETRVECDASIDCAWLDGIGCLDLHDVREQDPDRLRELYSRLYPEEPWLRFPGVVPLPTCDPDRLIPLFRDRLDDLCALSTERQHLLSRRLDLVHGAARRAVQQRLDEEQTLLQAIHTARVGNIHLLPEEILAHVFRMVAVNDPYQQVKSVCRSWRDIMRRTMQVPLAWPLGVRLNFRHRWMRYFTGHYRPAVHAMPLMVDLCFHRLEPLVLTVDNRLIETSGNVVMDLNTIVPNMQEPLVIRCVGNVLILQYVVNDAHWILWFDLSTRTVVDTQDLHDLMEEDLVAGSTLDVFGIQGRDLLRFYPHQPTVVHTRLADDFLVPTSGPECQSIHLFVRDEHGYREFYGSVPIHSTVHPAVMDRRPIDGWYNTTALNDVHFTDSDVEPAEVILRRADNSIVTRFYSDQYYGAGHGSIVASINQETRLVVHDLRSDITYLPFSVRSDEGPPANYLRRMWVGPDECVYIHTFDNQLLVF